MHQMCDESLPCSVRRTCRSSPYRYLAGKQDSVDMRYASPLYLLLIFSTLICIAIGAPNIGCFCPKLSGTLVGTLGSNSVTTTGIDTQLDVTRARLSAQALQTQVLMSTRATRAEALAWARSLAALQDLWSGSWLSVICWSDAMIVACRCTGCACALPLSAPLRSSQVCQCLCDRRAAERASHCAHCATRSLAHQRA